MSDVLQIILILLFPIFSLWYDKKSTLSKWLSAIVLCYLVGILLRNLTPFPVNDALAQSCTEGSIALAIPLLLFGTRLKETLNYSRSSLLSFGLCVFAGLISCFVATLIFKDQVADAWMVGGMLVGIYTGGTPNMQAIGLALGAEQENIILLNAADIVTGGLYLILLTSILPSLLETLLPAYDQQIGNKERGEDELGEKWEKWPLDSEQTGLNTNANLNNKADKWREWLWAFLLSIFVLGTTIGLSFLLFGNMQNAAFIMLGLTTLSIIASFLPFVQKWKFTYDLGEYFLLIFCVALGLQADFSTMIKDGGIIVLYTATAMYACIFLHLILARIFKIDRDTFLITSTAALYGPAFIGQVASVIKNRSLIFPGIALGLLGYAIGNYLGIALANLLRWLF